MYEDEVVGLCTRTRRGRTSPGSHTEQHLPLSTRQEERQQEVCGTFIREEKSEPGNVLAQRLRSSTRTRRGRPRLWLRTRDYKDEVVVYVLRPHGGHTEAMGHAQEAAEDARGRVKPRAVTSPFYKTRRSGRELHFYWRGGGRAGIRSQRSCTRTC